MERGARRGDGDGLGALAGGLQAQEVVEQGPAGAALGQEGDGLLDAVGVALAASLGPLLVHFLLGPPDLQVGHGHLQDVGLLLLGVGLLADKLLAQQGLELLDAGVDAVAPQLLNHGFPQLWRKRAEEPLDQLNNVGTLFFLTLFRI